MRLYIFTLLVFIPISWVDAQDVYQLDSGYISKIEFDINNNPLYAARNGTANFIFKTNSQNSLLWAKKMNGEFINDMISFDNDIFIHTISFNNNALRHVSMMDSLGNLIWSKEYSNSVNVFNSIINCPVSVNGNHYLGLIYYDTVSIYFHVLSNTGAAIFSKVIPTQSPYQINSLSGTADSSGNTYISYLSNNTYYLIKLDINGNLVFHKSYYDQTWLELFYSKMIMISNSELVLLIGNSYTHKPFIFKLDSAGNFLSGKEFLNTYGGNYFLKEMKKIGNEIFFTGDINPIDQTLDTNGYFVSVVKTDLNMNIINDVHTYLSKTNIASNHNGYSGYISTEKYYSIFNSNMIFDCDTIDIQIWNQNIQTLLPYQSFTQSNNTLALATANLTSSNYNINITSPCQLNKVSNIEALYKLTIFPNPSSSQFTLFYSGEEKDLSYSIHDIFGKEITSGKIILENTSIDCSKWNKGVYLVKIGNEKGYSVKKMVVE